jgi:hypothetical protein
MGFELLRNQQPDGSTLNYIIIQYYYIGVLTYIIILYSNLATLNLTLTVQEKSLHLSYKLALLSEKCLILDVQVRGNYVKNRC